MNLNLRGREDLGGLCCCQWFIKWMCRDELPESLELRADPPIEDLADLLHGRV